MLTSPGAHCHIFGHSRLFVDDRRQPMTVLALRLQCATTAAGGLFRGGRVGTPSPLLKCLRTYYGQHCEPFSVQKYPILQDLAYRISKFLAGVIPLDPAERLRCLNPYTNFRFAHQRSHCSCFTKRPLTAASKSRRGFANYAV